MAPSLLLAVLAQLDPTNDNHWTVEGSPRLDTVKLLSGETVTREQIALAAPGFSRNAPLQGADAAGGGVGAGEGAGEPPVAPQGPSQGDSNAVVDLQGGAPGGAAAKDPDEGEADPFALAQRAHDEALARKAKADTDVAATGKALDRLIEARDKAGAGARAHSPVAQYHARQRELLNERAEKMQALKGIDLRSILPSRAPIDLALARKTARGTQRPKMG
jgi:hypothetical protein